ncbi:MAG: PAS domain S-box protein [Rubrivivax sp.]|nr:PAS domain S-box protein [Rubrivivax sp.]
MDRGRFAIAPPGQAAPNKAPPEARKLRLQLVALALGLMLLSALLLAVTLARQRTQAIDSGQRLNQSLALVVETQAVSAVQAVDQRLQLAAQGLDMLEAAGGWNDAAVRTLLIQHAAALPFVRAIWVLDAQGRVLHAPEASAVGLQLADREFFQAYQRDPETSFYLGAPVRSRATGDWLVSAARPLHSASGALVGVIVAGLDPPFFDRLWSALDLGPDGAVALLRRDGVLLMRSPILESAMGQSFAGSALFSQRLATQPSGSYVGASPVDGRQRLNAYRSLTGPPELLVLVARSRDAVLAPWREQVLLASSILATAAVVVGLLFAALDRAWRQRLLAAADARQMAKRLELATDAAAIGVWDWDLLHDHWQASPTWYTMLGHAVRPGPAAGPPSLQAVHPDDRAMVAVRIQAVLDGADAPFGYEARMQHADGSLRWMQVAGRVLARDAASKATRLLGVRIDITERQQLMQQLQASEARFRAFFEQAAVGVAHVALDGTFALVNQRFADIAGRSRADLQACTFQQITHPDDLASDIDQVRRLQAGEITTYAMEKRYLRPDDSLVWVNLTVSMVRDAMGMPLHFVSVVEDINVRKLSEQRQLEQLNELRRWHTAMLGRELRTIEVKREVNALLAATGQPARYADAEPSAAERGT